MATWPTILTVIVAAWALVILFAWIKFRAVISGGRAGDLYRAHERETRMMGRSHMPLQIDEPYGDVPSIPVHMIGERNG